MMIRQNSSGFRPNIIWNSMVSVTYDWGHMCIACEQSSSASSTKEYRWTLIWNCCSNVQECTTSGCENCRFSCIFQKVFKNSSFYQLSWLTILKLVIIFVILSLELCIFTSPSEKSKGYERWFLLNIWRNDWCILTEFGTPRHHSNAETMIELRDLDFIFKVTKAI